MSGTQAVLLKTVTPLTDATEPLKLVLYTTLDVVLYFKDRKLVEIFYDPIFAKAKMA